MFDVNFYLVLMGRVKHQKHERTNKTKNKKQIVGLFW